MKRVTYPPRARPWEWPCYPGRGDIPVPAPAQSALVFSERCNLSAFLPGALLSRRGLLPSFPTFLRSSLSPSALSPLLCPPITYSTPQRG